MVSLCLSQPCIFAVHSLISSLTKHTRKIWKSSLVQDCLLDPKDWERGSACYSQSEELLQVALQI